MKLFLDTSSNSETVVRLDDTEIKKGSKVTHSQVVLPMIENLLDKKGKKLADITEIEVATGPGSFTGLRVGAAIANALGFALKVSVNGKKPWEMEIVVPTYE